MIKNKKILITGGAGFIGSHLVERLYKSNSIIVFDNFSTGKITNIEKLKDGITLIKGDIINYTQVLKAIKDVDYIIHQAFPYGVATRDLNKQFIEEGAIGTFNILRAAVENNVEKVIYASSVAVYGIQDELPIKENNLIAPFLPYGATKYVGELYCKTISNIFNLQTVSLRYFNVYGPRYSSYDHSALINFLTRALKGKDLIIYGNGEQIRDYTYIDDVVEGTILCLEKDKFYGEVFNIGSGNGIKILDLAHLVAEIVKEYTKKDINIRFAHEEEYNKVFKGLPRGVTKKIGDKYVDERNYIADITKAKKILGYSPKVGLKEGIVKTLEWLLNKND